MNFSNIQLKKGFFNLFTLVVFLATSNLVFSQAPGLCWQKNYGTSSQETSTYVQEIPGGGMIMAFTAGNIVDFDLQSTLPLPLGGSDVIVMEIDDCGKIIWSKRIGSAIHDRVYSLIRLNDGSIVLGCETSRLSGADRALMVTYKLDSSGNVIWSTTNGVNGLNQYGGYASVATNGDVFVTGITGLGWSVPGYHGNNDVVVVRLDGSTGAVVWRRAYGTSAVQERGFYVASSFDNGGLFLSQSGANGEDVTGNHGGNDIWVGKFDSLSNLEWQRSLGGSANEELAGSILQLVDSSYMVIGSTPSTDFDAVGNHGGFDILVVKLDKNGNTLWSRVYGGSGNEFSGVRGGNPITQSSDGNVIFVGKTTSSDGDVSFNHGGEDIWMVKIDSSNGNIIWEKTLGSTGNENANTILELYPDNFILSGSSNGSLNGDFDQANYGNGDSWVIRLSDKCLGPLYQNVTNISTPETCNSNDGSASITVPNRLLPNDYRWINPAGITSTDSFLVNLHAGTYEMEVTDFIGCIDTFTVTVGSAVDNVAPVFSCLANQTLNINSSCLASIPDYTALITAMDNCGDTNVVITQTPLLGTTVGLGNTIIWIFAEDASGNIDSCSFTVTVVDNESPIIINCPTNISLTNTLGTCGATATWILPTATDNCQLDTLTSNYASGSVFPLGLTTVIYVAYDESGNTDTCSFTVTVVDNELPVISNCPTDIVLTNTTGSCGAIATWTLPIATDNCQLDTLTSNYTSGSVFPLGLTTVIYVAYDESGNTDTCSFTVTVVDNESPVISNCPTDIVLTNTIGTCGATATWTLPTATDNCQLDTLTSNYASGSVFPLGLTTVTYVAYDESGNTDTCSFTVTVVDNESPVISNCPTDIVLTNTIGTCGATATWTLPMATDNCQLDSLTSDYTSGSVFPLGITTVTYIAYDAAGNSDSCSFTITVNDAELPLISNCPTDIVLTNTTGSCGATATWTLPTATDNCGTPTLTSSHTSGSVFPVGITSVVYTATDASGNIDSCSFTVIVTDDELPVISITGLPSVICESSTVTWQEMITDNCGVSTVTSSHNSGSVFPVGTTSVNYTVTDIHGNVSTYSFDIVVSPSPVVNISNTSNELTICLATDLKLEVSNSVTGITYRWSKDGVFVGTGDTYSVTSTEIAHGGFYTVVAENALGCVSEADSIIVKIISCDISIPEIFSPNEDGKNDVFFIDGLSAYPNTKVWIHNRWGTEVFQSDNYQSDWNGKSQSKLNISGDDLPEGTYFYILQLGGVEGQPNTGEIYKGYVYLKR